MAALEIRKDRTPTVLRKLAKAEADTRVARRMLAIANALDGMSREEAARSAGMDRQTLRDWVVRYNEHGIDGLADRWGDGRPPTFDGQEQAELMRIVLDGPDPEASGLSAYTLEDLANICDQRFGKRMHPWSLGRLLKRLGFSRQKTRPSHPQKDPAAQAAFKKSPSAAQNKTRPASGRRGARATSGGGGASVRRGSATSASRSPTSSQPSSREPTTPLRSSCRT